MKYSYDATEYCIDCGQPTRRECERCGAPLCKDHGRLCDTCRGRRPDGQDIRGGGPHWDDVIE